MAQVHWPRRWEAGSAHYIFSAVCRKVHQVSTWGTQSSLSSIWERSCCHSGKTAGECWCLTCCHSTPASLSSCFSSEWITWPVKFNTSAWTISPSASSTTTPDHPLQVSPLRSRLSWAWKCSSTHFTAQTLHPSTITGGYPWETLCSTSNYLTKKTWISGWGISLPSSPEQFLMMSFKIGLEKEDRDQLCWWFLGKNIAFVHHGNLICMDLSWNSDKYSFNWKQFTAFSLP